jgi:ADP-ribose pyrophosphatase YjhB (NUDIX family)
MYLTMMVEQSKLYKNTQPENFPITNLWCYNPELEFVSSNEINSKLNTSIEKKEERQIRSGVIFIIQNEDVEKIKILVVKGQSKNGQEGIWSIPKGRQSYCGENTESCAIREVFEETGIKLTQLENLPKCKIAHNIYYKYITSENEFTEFKIQDVSEVEKVEWKTISELRKMNCNKDLRSLLLYPYKKFSYHTVIFS